jgi:spermidine synthase
MQQTERRLFPAVALISGAALGYELLLLRFFSLLYWSHFAHLIISMALLGIGISGTVLALFQNRLIPHFHRTFFLSALLFAFTLLMSTSLAGRIGFNPPEVIWDAGQLGRLAAVFLLVTLPFFCSGLCIGLALRWKTQQVAQIYRADLTGAACGALLIIGMLFFLTPQNGVRVLALAGLSAAFLLHSGGAKKFRRSGFAIGALLILLWPAAWLTPVMSSFKALPQSLQIPGVQIASEKQSPSGDFTAVTSATVPFRFAPGLSMLAPVTPPEQVALFQDGHSAGMIQCGTNGAAAMEFMRWTPMHLPYVMLNRPRVLIPGAGGGGDVWHAQIENAAHIDAVEPHRELIDFVCNRFRTFSGDLCARDTVHLHLGDARGFLAAATGSYDLIQISPFGTAAPPVSGGHALNAQYLYTVEGLHLALSRLSERGILSVTLTLDLPPRSAVKMMDTFAEALKRNHISDPFRHLAVIRTWNTVTLAASPSPLTSGQLSAIRDFCRSRAFDLVWLPDITAAEVNRINVLERPFLYEAALDIRRGNEYRRLNAFNVTPATDDRPWFNRFFRWRSFRDLWAQRASGSASMLEWDYLLLWMSLAVALAVSLLLIAWPLRHLYRTQLRAGREPGGFAVPAVYFASLGLAFLFLEIAYIQKFILFLNQPITAMAVIVPSFLFFAGCGSGQVGRLVWFKNRPVTLATGGIVIVSALYLWILPPLFHAGADWPEPLRVITSILLIGGLAFWMGMPFPLGLKRLGQSRPDFVPFAWGINGFFSVISAIAATILALHAGFRIVILVALGLYLLAAAIEHRL